MNKFLLELENPFSAYFWHISPIYGAKVFFQKLWLCHTQIYKDF